MTRRLISIWGCLANRFCILLTFGCVAFSNAALFATPLPIGSAILSSAGPAPSGTILADTGVLPYTSATFTGTLRSEVINDPANPNGLTFVYSLTNVGDATHVNSIGRLTVPGYGVVGVTTDASYVAVAGNTVPTSFDRSSAATLGDVVGTSFTSTPLGMGEIPPGFSADTIVIRTNATNFKASVASVIDGSTAQVTTFAPTNLVPEPSTLALGILGLAAVAVARRRF